MRDIDAYRMGYTSGYAEGVAALQKVLLTTPPSKNWSHRSGGPAANRPSTGTRRSRP